VSTITKSATTQRIQKLIKLAEDESEKGFGSSLLSSLRNLYESEYFPIIAGAAAGIPTGALLARYLFDIDPLLGALLGGGLGAGAGYGYEKLFSVESPTKGSPTTETRKQPEPAKKPTIKSPAAGAKRRAKQPRTESRDRALSQEEQELAAIRQFRNLPLTGVVKGERVVHPEEQRQKLLDQLTNTKMVGQMIAKNRVLNNTFQLWEALQIPPGARDKRYQLAAKNMELLRRVIGKPAKTRLQALQKLFPGKKPSEIEKIVGSIEFDPKTEKDWLLYKMISEAHADASRGIKRLFLPWHW